jgi:integrase
MQTRFKFTNTNLKAVAANDMSSRSTELELSDSELSGLKLLVGKSGNKRFLFRYSHQSKKRSITIGKFPDIDTATARKIVRKYKGMLADDTDPKAENENHKAIPTLSQFFWGSYLPYIKRHKRSWRHDVQRFRDYIEKRFGDRLYTDIKALDVQQLQMDMSDGNGFVQAYAPATCNRTLASLKTMGQQAIAWGIIEINEANKIKLLKEDNQRTRFFSVPEMRKVITQALKYPNPYAGSFIALLLYTGVRKMELLTVKWRDLDKATKRLHIFMSKTDKRRELYLSNEMMSIICSLTKRRNNPYIFSSRITGKHISEPRWAYGVILKNAGIDSKDVCFHTARHSVASALVSAGKSLYDVKTQLGHASIVSSERYAKLTEERQRTTGQVVSDLISG